MQLFWTKSSSTVKPSDVDYTSSPTTVYLHRNVTERTTSDGVKFYDYEECKLTREQFTQYVVNNFDTVSSCIDDFGELISVNASAIDEAMTMLSDIQERLTKLEEK